MITENSAKGLGDKKLSNFFKKPKNILLTVLLSVITIMLALILFITCYNAVLVRQYQKDLTGLASSFADIDSTINERTARLSSAELLLNNTNRILSTVYFGTADTDERKEAKDFTAFSIIYKDKYYLITAGHCIEYENIKYKNFKFIANNSRTWLAPGLLTYENDYANNKDYAIFYKENLITMGLYPAAKEEDQSPQYVLGNTERDLNLIKKYKDAMQGESGSPVINSKCHVVGIMIKKDGSYTPIQEVLDAIDKSGI
jgi:V8-like Glu-specific endopeptidase